MNATTKANGKMSAHSKFPSELREFHGFSDARLVELVKDGSSEAFGEIVRRYEGRLTRVISRFIIDRHVVEDIAQDVFVRVFRRMELFDASRRFGPWLLQIGVNQTLDYLRKTRRRIRWSLFSQKADEELRTIEPPEADPREKLDTAQEVRVVLNMLPENYRTVLILRDLENFSTAEIAAILDRKEATIRWRLAEARTRFQRLWTARQNREPLADLNRIDTDELRENPQADRIVGGDRFEPVSGE